MQQWYILRTKNFDKPDLNPAAFGMCMEETIPVLFGDAINWANNPFILVALAKGRYSR